MYNIVSFSSMKSVKMTLKQCEWNIEKASPGNNERHVHKSWIVSLRAHSLKKVQANHWFRSDAEMNCVTNLLAKEFHCCRSYYCDIITKSEISSCFDILFKSIIHINLLRIQIYCSDLESLCPVYFLWTSATLALSEGDVLPFLVGFTIKSNESQHLKVD